MLSRVRSYYETLKTSQFGKHIVNRLEKLLSAGMRIQVNSLNSTPLLPVMQQPGAVVAQPAVAGTAAAVAAPTGPESQQQLQQPQQQLS